MTLLEIFTTTIVVAAGLGALAITFPVYYRHLHDSWRKTRVRVPVYVTVKGQSKGQIMVVGKKSLRTLNETNGITVKILK
jgi:hypothetical protein